jgi:hypothetical protein
VTFLPPSCKEFFKNFFYFGDFSFLWMVAEPWGRAIACKLEGMSTQFGCGHGSDANLGKCTFLRREATESAFLTMRDGGFREGRALNVTNLV